MTSKKVATTKNHYNLYLAVRFNSLEEVNRVGKILKESRISFDTHNYLIVVKEESNQGFEPLLPLVRVIMELLEERYPFLYIFSLKLFKNSSSLDLTDDSKDYISNEIITMFEEFKKKILKSDIHIFKDGSGIESYFSYMM